MSTQDVSPSPGLRKGTFGTPIGMKKKKENEVLYLTLMWKRKTGVSFFNNIIFFSYFININHI